MKTAVAPALAATAGTVIAWLLYVGAFLLLAPHVGRGAASLAAIPALAGGYLLGWRGGLAMGAVSLVLNEILLTTTGGPFSFTASDFYYASLSSAIGGGVGWVQGIRRKLREAVSRANEKDERYQLVTRATNDMIWDLDFASGIAWRNENFSAFIPANAVPDASAWKTRIHPDDAAQVTASMDAVLADRSQLQWSAEYRFRRLDGSYATVLDRGYVSRDADGAAVRMIGSMQDVSEKKAAERALRESEATFRTFFHNVPVGLYRTTPNGSVLLANPALLSMLGYDSLEELQQRDLNEGIEAQYSRKAFTKRLERDGVVHNLVSTWTTRDGRKLEVREQATLVKTESGKPLYYEGTLEDITERLRLEHAAQRQQKALERAERLSALGTLVAGVAHEVNNPLAYIRGNVELVDMTLGDVAGMELPPSAEPAIEEARAQLQVALRGVDQIGSIVSSLRAVARSSAESRTDEDIDELVRNVMRVAQARIPDGALVQADLRSRRTVSVVADQIAQVVLNLLFNSADAVRDRLNGEINVRTYETEKATVIEIEDNGVGIPLELQPRIFVPFHTTKHSGTGLGLSVSHGIVQSHGGAISFESTPGTGTVFRVVLPSA